MPQTDAPSTENPPRHCPTCDVDLSPYPYYQRIPGQAARGLHKLGKLSIVLMTVFVILSFSNGEAPMMLSLWGGFLILFVICAPAAFLYGYSLLFPQDYQVICLRCSWTRNYAFRSGPLRAADSD